MQFHVEKITVVMALCALTSTVGAQEHSKPAAAATKPAAKAAANEPKQGLFSAQRYVQVAISPDGKQVAWVEIRADAEGSATGKQDIFVTDSGAAEKPARLTAGAPTTHWNEGNVAWSP